MHAGGINPRQKWKTDTAEGTAEIACIMDPDGECAGMEQEPLSALFSAAGFPDFFFFFFFFNFSN
jgi:hypothetical protein